MSTDTIQTDSIKTDTIKTDKIQQEWTPDGGIKAVEENGLKSSWKRGGSAGSYDFKFDYEGATVYCRYPKDFSELETEQNRIVEEAQSIDADLTRLFEAQSKNPKKNYDAEVQLRNERANQLAIRSARFAHEVVQKCVIGWKGAPLPYSEAGKAELPLRMLQDWFQPILENSRLSKVEADFLAAS